MHNSIVTSIAKLVGGFVIGGISLIAYGEWKERQEAKKFAVNKHVIKAPITKASVTEAVTPKAPEPVWEQEPLFAEAPEPPTQHIEKPEPLKAEIRNRKGEVVGYLAPTKNKTGKGDFREKLKREDSSRS